MSIYVQLAIALGLGLLVGLQRQHVGSQMAGIRTFPLITLSGAMCGLLAQNHGGWIIAAGLLGIAALIVVSNLLRMRGADPKIDRGMTTEAAALLMFIAGAAVASGFEGPAVVVGGVVGVLLHIKQPLHHTIRKIGEHDMRAIYTFVLISMVILPVLPDKAYGPYGVLNPRTIWLMVVLIVGMGLVAYVIYKIVGARTGTLLGGVLGGMISSTATTVSYSRRASATGDGAGLASAVIMIASAISFVRVLVEIAAVAPGALKQMAPPLVAMFAVMVVISAVALWRYRGEKAEMPQQSNPTELKAALIFGVLYAAVIFAVAAVKEWAGDRGLYAVAVVSGLTDMDAITLSTSELVHAEALDATTGWRMILVGAMSNLVFKAGVVSMLGSRRLLVRVLVWFGLSMAGGAAILLAWPLLLKVE